MDGGASSGHFEQNRQRAELEAALWVGVRGVKMDEQKTSIVGSVVIIVLLIVAGELFVPEPE